MTSPLVLAGVPQEGDVYELTSRTGRRTPGM